MSRRIYLASSWRNPYQADLVQTLRNNNHQVYDFKNPPNGVKGFSWSEIDPDWHYWDTHSFREKLEMHQRASQGFLNDFRNMRWADTCVLLMPSGLSAHLEAGWFTGAGKRCIVYMPKELVKFEPELMYLLCDTICVSETELLRELEK